MKKVFRMSALAIMVMGLATACNQAPAENTDSTNTDSMPATVEEMVDTVAADTLQQAEEPVKAEAKKATVKKDEPKKKVKEYNPEEPAMKAVEEGEGKAKATTLKQKSALEAAKVDNNNTNTKGPKGRLKK